MLNLHNVSSKILNNSTNFTFGNGVALFAAKSATAPFYVALDVSAADEVGSEDAASANLTYAALTQPSFPPYSTK